MHLIGLPKFPPKVSFVGLARRWISFFINVSFVEFSISVGFGNADVNGASCISFSLLDNWLGQFWLGFVIELIDDVSIGGGHVVHVVAVEGVQGAVAVLAVDLDLERPTLVAKADGLVGGALLVVVDDVWGGRGAAVLVVDDDCLPNFVGRALSRLGGNVG